MGVKTLYNAVIVKSQQWPTPSESIAIYLHKETSFVCYTSSVLIQIEFIIQYNTIVCMRTSQTAAKFIKQKYFGRKAKIL